MLFHRNKTIQARGKKIQNKAIIEMIQRKTIRILLLLNGKRVFRARINRMKIQTKLDNDDMYQDI